MAAAQTKNIVILGGSYAGLSTAHYLLKHAVPALPDAKTYRVVLVSASAEVMCRPACPRACIAEEMFPQDKLFVGISSVLEQYPKDSVRFVYGSATDLDHAGRKVTVALHDNTTETIDFYALVIATGSSTPSPLLSLNRDADFLRSSWVDFRKALPASKSIVIAGGGPAGVETAGELGEFLNGRPGWFGSPPDHPKVAITLVTAASQILPALRPAIAETAEKYLAKVGVTVRKNARVSAVTPAGAGRENVAANAVVTIEDGSTLEADLYIPAVGTQPNTGFVAKDLLAADGRVEVNASTLRVDKAGPRIYAVGDVANYSRPAVHLILNAVPSVCANIKRDLLLDAGAKTPEIKERAFEEDKRETQMVPIGKGAGVGAAMGYRLPSFLVWLIKGRDYWLWTTGGLWSGKQWAKES